MTWDDFKREIDERLKTAGKDGSVALEHIRFQSETGSEMFIFIGTDADDDRLHIWNAAANTDVRSARSPR